MSRAADVPGNGLRDRGSPQTVCATRQRVCALCADKHGVLGLTKSAALEYAPRGIRVNAICPGTIDTPMVTRMIETGERDMAEAIRNPPIRPLGTAAEIAAALLWLCSPAASFIVGVALPVDGGYTAA